LTGLSLLIGVALAGGRHRCTLAAELGFTPVRAGENAWVALVQPVGWDTQGECPREPRTVRFTAMPDMDPAGIQAGHLPVFHYQHSEEMTPRGPMVLDLWALVGTTRAGGATDGCETTVEILKVKGDSPPTVLVRPVLPIEALGCPVPGRPLEVVLETQAGVALKRGDRVRVRRRTGSLRWTVQPSSGD